MFNNLKRWCKDNKVLATFVAAMITGTVGFLYQRIGIWLDQPHSHENTPSTVSTSTHTPASAEPSPILTTPSPGPVRKLLTVCLCGCCPGRLV